MILSLKIIIFLKKNRKFFEKLTNFQKVSYLWRQNFGTFFIFSAQKLGFSQKVTPSLGRSLPLLHPLISTLCIAPLAEHGFRLCTGMKISLNFQLATRNNGSNDLKAISSRNKSCWIIYLVSFKLLTLFNPKYFTTYSTRGGPPRHILHFYQKSQ